jgi:hypothetical protein
MRRASRWIYVASPGTRFQVFDFFVFSEREDFSFSFLAPFALCKRLKDFCLIIVSMEREESGGTLWQ